MNSLSSPVISLDAARAAAEPWPKPHPLTRPAPPVLDLAVAIPDHLTELREFCEAVAKSVQAPLDGVSPLAVALASIGTARALELEPGPGWRETAPLWAVCLNESGERKSATTDLIKAPLEAWQNDERDYLRHSLADYDERRRVTEARLEGVRNHLKKPKCGDVAKLETDARDLRAALEKMPPLSAPQLILSDSTPECLRDTLERNGEKVIRVSDEISAAELLGTRYGKGGANIDIPLKCHNGGSHTIGRAGRFVHLMRPALVEVLYTQAGAMRTVLNDSYATEKGYVARFMLVAPESRMGTRLELTPGEVPAHLREWWATRVRQLLDLKWPGRVILTADGPTRYEGAPRVLTLTTEARAVFDPLRLDLEKRIGPDGDLRPLAAFTSKLPGTVARIALTLEAIGNPAAEVITGETMRAACEWAPWLIAHARHVLGDAAEPDEVKLARRLLAHVKRNQIAELSARDALRLFGGNGPTMEELTPALDLLVESDWLRALLAEPHVIGRKPSPRYAVNPAALA